MDKDAGMTVKPRGGKAFNKLGITTIDIISQMFTTKAGRADKNAYQLFWNLMNDLENTTIFVNEVLSKLLNYEPAGASSSNASSGGSSSSSSSSSSASQSGVGGSLPGQQAACAVSIESLLTTLSFITLQLDFNMQDGKVRQHLDTWTKQVANGQLARAYPAIKDVMRLLVLRCEGGDMFGPLIIGCSTMHSVSDFQRLSDIVSFPTLDEADLKSGDACFLYPYLRRCLSHPTAHRSVASPNNAMMMGGSTSLYHAVLANTANKMLTLPQQMKASPRVAETTFCSLLHMLRHVLSLGIHTDAGHLRSLQAILQPFYLWPLPYASMTRDLLVRLQQELRMPGTLLRAKIGEEIVCAEVEEVTDEPVGALFYFVDEKDEASLSAVQTMQLKQLKSEVLQPTRRTRSNHNNYSNNFNNRSNASSSSSSSSSPDEPTLLTPSLQAQIVLNMIHTDAGPLTEADVNQMKSLNADAVGQLYRRAISMTGEVLEKQEQVKELRAKQAQLLRQMVKEKAASSSSGGGDVKLPELFCQPPYLPQLPAVSHQMYARTLSFSYPTFDAKTRTLDFPTSSLYPDLLALCEAVTNKALADTDSNNNNNNSTGSPSPSPIIVRIAIAGGDELTHHFLCAYMLLRSKQPHFFTAASLLQFRFYIVPFQRNAMAAWLARHDSWYHRHVYQPFRTPTFVIPSIKSEGGEQITEADDKLAMPPVGVYLRSLMELYAREAIYHVVEFHVYQCSAWTYPEARDPSHIIPFCQRMEIGVNAVPGGGGGSGGGGAGSAANNNADDFLPPDIIVKFTKMDLSGHVVETVCDDGAPYSMIVLSSVPRKSDASFPSSPACPWLEMYAKPHRTFQKSAARKNTLVNDPRQHVVELELTCVQPSYQFGVLLDGSYFGPYHKIKIGPIVTADEKQGALAKRMKFAIQNYFPIDV